MRRLSLSTRLIATFVAVTLVCFGVVGLLLYNTTSQRIYAQDETNLVLSARHLRRLVAEMDSIDGLLRDQDRLVIGVLGDTNNALRITNGDGRVLVEHNPLHYAVDVLASVPPDQRIVPADLRDWHDANGGKILGVATGGLVKDGSKVTIVVARLMTDRTSLLSRYRSDLVTALLAGMLASAVLSYLLVRHALLPLHAMAEGASAVTARRLSTRLHADNATAELHTLAGALNAMLARLEEGFAHVWQFTVDLAHDLRTPIANLRGANEVALNRPRSVDEYKALLASNIEECDRVSRTIESVLFLARADNPRYALQCVRIDTAEELQRIADYFEGPSSEAGVSICVDACGTVYADRDLFRRAVSNLLANALRYTASGNTIQITAHTADGGIHVVVENPGPGIEAEHLGKLFDRFYRVDPSRSDSATSTGLGLSIVKQVMQLHDGTVGVQSSDDKTRFTLYFSRPPAGPHA